MMDKTYRKTPVLHLAFELNKNKSAESIVRKIPAEFRDYIQLIEVRDKKLFVEVDMKESTRKFYVNDRGSTASKQCIDETYLHYQGLVGSILEGVYKAIGEQPLYKGTFSLENMLGYTLVVNQTDRKLTSPNTTFATNKYTMHYEFKRMTDDKVEKEWDKFLNNLFKMLST